MVANKLLKSKAIYLGILYIYNVKWDFLSNEFCIVLKKNKAIREKNGIKKCVWDSENKIEKEENAK